MLRSDGKFRCQLKSFAAEVVLKFTMPKFRQLLATVKKHLIEKKRNLRISFVEHFCHLVIFGILVFGLTLSKTVWYEPENFVKFDVLIPPMSGGSPIEQAPATSVGIPSGNNTTGTTKHFGSDDPTYAMNYNSFLGGLKRQLKGPMLIPSFDQFVTYAQVFTIAANSMPLLQWYISHSSVGQLFG